MSTSNSCRMVSKHSVSRVPAAWVEGPWAGGPVGCRLLCCEYKAVVSGKRGGEDEERTDGVDGGRHGRRQRGGGRWESGRREIERQALDSVRGPPNSRTFVCHVFSSAGFSFLGDMTRAVNQSCGVTSAPLLSSSQLSTHAPSSAALISRHVPYIDSSIPQA